MKINTRWRRNKSWIEGDCGFIELRNNRNEPICVAVVDREDLFRCVFEKKWRLCKTSGNVVSSSDGVETLQRFVLRIPAGDGYFVSHDDGNPLKNKKNNLSYGSNVNQHQI